MSTEAGTAMVPLNDVIGFYQQSLKMKLEEKQVSFSFVVSERTWNQIIFVSLTK